MATKWNDECPLSPGKAALAAWQFVGDERRKVYVHECMKGEMRCAYCGIRLTPHTCNGCGKFLKAKEMHDGETRCERCM